MKNLNHYVHIIAIRFLWVLMVLTPLLAKAQKNTVETLHSLNGHWNIENYEWKANTWQTIGNTNSTITSEHQGKFISEKVKYLSKYGEINIITNIGYDNRLKKFKLCAMDKEFGFMDIYYGQWINGALVFTNLESDIPVKLEDGRELSFRLTYSNINNQGFTHLVEGTFDKGKTWFKFSKGIYKRTTIYEVSEQDQKEIEALKKSIPLVLANQGWDTYEKLFSKNYQNWHMLGDQVRNREDYLSAVKQWYNAGNRANDSEIESIAFIPLAKNKVMYLHKQIERFDLVNEKSKTVSRDIRFIGVFIKEDGRWKVDFTAFMDAPLTN